MPTIYQTTLIALLAAFIILFLGKTGYRYKLRDYFDKIGIGLIAEMLDCDFCISFWICIIISILFMCIGYDLSLLTPFIATPITRYLL